MLVLALCTVRAFVHGVYVVRIVCIVHGGSTVCIVRVSWLRVSHGWCIMGSCNYYDWSV